MEILPKEINHIIISYISLNDRDLLKFLEAYPKYKQDQWLFHQLFQFNFPGLYSDVSKLENIDWYEYYTELTQEIPDTKEIELYGDKINDRRNPHINHRSLISEPYILSSISQLELPDFIFKALFKKYFPVIYSKLNEFKNVKYKIINIIYRISYSSIGFGDALRDEGAGASLTDTKDEWYLLAEYDFDNIVTSMLKDINNNTEILDVILNDSTVKKFLEDVFIDDIMINLVKDESDNELFKYLYKKYPVDNPFTGDWLSISQYEDNEELVEFLQKRR